jgi:hypothetical protein
VLFLHTPKHFLLMDFLLHALVGESHCEGIPQTPVLYPSFHWTATISPAGLWDENITPQWKAGWGCFPFQFCFLVGYDGGFAIWVLLVSAFMLCAWHVHFMHKCLGNNKKTQMLTGHDQLCDIIFISIFNGCVTQTYPYHVLTMCVHMHPRLQSVDNRL